MTPTFLQKKKKVFFYILALFYFAVSWWKCKFVWYWLCKKCFSFSFALPLSFAAKDVFDMKVESFFAFFGSLKLNELWKLWVFFLKLLFNSLSFTMLSCIVNLISFLYVFIILFVMQRYFGHFAFRPSQKEIINEVLGGKDCLVVMATGSGKSVW